MIIPQSRLLNFLPWEEFVSDFCRHGLLEREKDQSSRKFQRATKNDQIIDRISTQGRGKNDSFSGKGHELQSLALWESLTDTQQRYFLAPDPGAIQVLTPGESCPCRMLRNY